MCVCVLAISRSEAENQKKRLNEKREGDLTCFCEVVRRGKSVQRSFCFTHTREEKEREVKKSRERAVGCNSLEQGRKSREKGFWGFLLSSVSIITRGPVSSQCLQLFRKKEKCRQSKIQPTLFSIEREIYSHLYFLVSPTARNLVSDEIDTVDLVRVSG